MAKRSQALEGYRQRIEFDDTRWGSHCVDCYPGACPYKVYVKDNKIVREEVAGIFPTFEEGVPDMNPLGCQKGASWSAQLYSKDRLLYPMRRIGERGEGKWERISWDEALTEIADSIIDVIETDGPHSIVHEGTPEVVVVPAVHRFMHEIGGTITDINGSINDLALGHHLTFGRFYPIGSNDDIFHSETIILWHTNPAYTCIPFFHYIIEARYKGAQVILFAPDVSPSHSHVDYHIPIEWGSDPALALSMCQVIIEEGLQDDEFIKTQTDLSLLVRSDNGMFLRQSDINENGLDDQFYHIDQNGEVILASRTNLLEAKTVSLLNKTEMALKDGTKVTVFPLFVRLQKMLDENYKPEMTEQTTEVNPEVLRMLARRIARTKTKILMGMGACKAYHSDLYQRTMNLLLGITGNWGKKGTGINCWAVGLFDGQTTVMVKQKYGIEGADEVINSLNLATDALKEADPSLDDLLATIETWRMMPQMGGRAMFPAFFLWYYHGAFRSRWNNPVFNDPAMRRSFDEYFEEAIDSNWFLNINKPSKEEVPKILIECGGNQLRRTRGGRKVLLDSLWKNLKLVVSTDIRMSATAMNSDIVLPAAQHYEKVAFHLPSPAMLTLQLSDKAAEPQGEAKEEWEIFLMLLSKIAERAELLGLDSFKVSDFGPEDQMYRKYSELPSRYTLDGHLLNSEDVAEEMVRDTVFSGTLDPKVNLEYLREKGWTRFKDWGMSPMAKGQSSPLPKDETLGVFRDHYEKGTPYPTLTRRAQFLIEHPWFVEAGEDLPVHKDPPAMGGNYKFRMTGGHNRWSIHAMNMGNPHILQTHRGEPHVVMHPRDAKDIGVEDNDYVLIKNDVGEYKVRIKLSPCQRPFGLTIYNGWDSFMFKDRVGSNEVEPGMVKWLNMAMGYGHLKYAPMEWQPAPVDRPIFVTVEKLN